MMIRKFFFVFLIPLVVYCGLLQDPYTVEEAAGVRIIHNHRPIMGENDISLSFIRKIGNQSDDENYIFDEPVDAVVDSKNNIYILDKGKHRIQKYDPLGNFILSIGKEGTGEGEFVKPDMLEITGSDEIVVCKYLKNIQRFSDSGELLGTIDVPANEREFKILDTGGIIMRNMISGSDISLFNRLSPEYKITGEFGEAVIDKDARKTVNQNLLYFETDSKDNLFVIFRHQNRLDKYTPGGDLLVQSDRKLEYEIEYTYSEDNKDFEGVPFAYAQHYFTIVSTGIGIDNQDRVWITTYRDHNARRPWEKFKFEIFSNEGTLLSELPLPEKVFNIIKISGNLLFCIDSNQRKCVYIYRITDID